MKHLNHSSKSYWRLTTALTSTFVLIALLYSCSIEEEVTDEYATEEVTNSNLTNSLTARGTAQYPNSEIVVSANGDDGNVPANTLDGKLSTRWSSNGRSGKYITFDLGSPQLVDNIKIAWFKGDQRKAYFKIRMGNSTSSLNTVLDKKSSGSSGSTKQLENYELNDTRARYVRISCFGNSSNSWNSITEVRIFTISDGGDPNPDPDPDPNPSGEFGYDILGLQNWKLNGLTGPPNNTTYVDQIPDLPTYEDPNYFFVEDDRKWVTFKAYVGNATSSGSGNPRCELREMTADGNSRIYWDGTTSKLHRMRWRVRVNKLPESGKLCFGQIHDKTDKFDDVIRVQFQGQAFQTSGNAKMKINGYVTEELGDKKSDDVGSFPLGQEIYLELTYQNSRVELWLLNGNGSRNRRIYRSPNVSAKENYFKAGAYLQSVKGKPFTNTSNFGSVSIRSLEVSH